jgi:hypothetical protein
MIPNALPVYHIVTGVVKRKTDEGELRAAILVAGARKLGAKPRGPAERTLSGETGKGRQITALED